MRLSEAIRLGAMWSPQGHTGSMNGTTRCALAAACDAVGIEPVAWHDGMLIANYPELQRRFTVLTGDVMWAIVTKNDIRGWTREQIADWVETIEQQQAVAGDQAADGALPIQGEERAEESAWSPVPK